MGVEKKRKVSSSDGAVTSTCASVMDDLEMEIDGDGEVAPPTSSTVSDT